MKKNNPPAQIIQGLQSGIDCLMHLVSSGEPIGCRELARRTGIESTRVNRILGTLAYMGLAARTPDKKYIPGDGINVLASLSMRSSPLLKVALPLLHGLARKVGVGVSLGVLWQDKVSYLFYGEDDSYASITGHRLFPADRSSIGLSLLAFREDDEISELFGAESEVLQKISLVRKQGYAVGDMGSVAVCVGGEMQLGGIAVNKYDASAGSMEEVVAALRACAEEITKEWCKATGKV